MIQELFLVTGYVFWISLALIILIDVFALIVNEDENVSEPQGWGMALTTIWFITAVCFTDAFVGARLEWLAGSLLGYIAIGVGWAFKKWIDYLRERKAYYRERYKPEEMGNKMPKAADHKGRIVTWMYLWPLSLTWWVLTWPRRAFVWAYNKLATVFDSVANRIWNS